MVGVRCWSQIKALARRCVDWASPFSRHCVCHSTAPCCDESTNSYTRHPYLYALLCVPFCLTLFDLVAHLRIASTP